MKSIFLMIMIGLCMSFNVSAQQGSDIYLGDLLLDKEPRVSNLEAITDNPSYTNQPYFFNFSRLYYTQEIKDEKAQSTQMDIFYYDVSSKNAQNITESNESEYSPTPTPDGKGISVIRVNAEGKQELWQLNFSGEPLQHYVPAIEPVGYQVWLNKKELLLFVLGEPHTLQKVSIDKPDAKGIIIDDNIGASLFQVEGSDWFLYSRSAEQAQLKAYHRKTGETRVLTALPEGSQYFSVSAGGDIITSDGKALYQANIQQSLDGDLSKEVLWSKLTVEHEKCSSDVSRTAISPDGKKIALVCPH